MPIATTTPRAVHTPDADIPLPAVPLADQPEPLATNVIEALRRVMRDLPAIGKEGTGPSSQGSYKFRGIEQIMRHAVPLFARHGVVFTPHRVDLRDHTDTLSGGKPAVDERVVVTYRVYGPGGTDDYIEVQAPGVGRDSTDKGSNKAMTAAYKYALTQTLGVADEKDDGDQYGMEADEPPVLATEAQVELLYDTLCAYLANHDGNYPDEWKAGPLPVRVETLEQIARGEKSAPSEYDVLNALSLLERLDAPDTDG